MGEREGKSQSENERKGSTSQEEGWDDNKSRWGQLGRKKPFQMNEKGQGFWELKLRGGMGGE